MRAILATGSGANFGELEISKSLSEVGPNSFNKPHEVNSENNIVS